MFFVDKYSPKTIDDAIIHKDELKKLQRMSKDESIPHLIFYGPEGCGKKTMINHFLEMIYGPSVNKIVEILYTVTGSGNSVQQIPIKQSPFHIIIEPNNNNFDRYLIQDVVKEYAKKVPNVFTNSRCFKIVLINNIDNLSYYAQTSLRRTMELYSDTCRFIMWSRSLSKVIDPLRSRCYCFRLKSPTQADLMEILLRISTIEKVDMKLEDYDDIISRADSNIKTALWLLELKKFNESFKTSYDDIIDTIISYITSYNLNNLQHIRLLLYKIMITNISGTQIIKDLVKKLLEIKDISFECKIEIPEISAKFEHNLIRGRREIIHLEAFINDVMFTLAKNNNFENKKKSKKIE